MNKLKNASSLYSKSKVLLESQLSVWKCIGVSCCVGLLRNWFSFGSFEIQIDKQQFRAGAGSVRWDDVSWRREGYVFISKLSTRLNIRIFVWNALCLQLSCQINPGRYHPIALLLTSHSPPCRRACPPCSSSCWPGGSGTGSRTDTPRATSCQTDASQTWGACHHHHYHHHYHHHHSIIIMTD